MPHTLFDGIRDRHVVRSSGDGRALITSIEAAAEPIPAVDPRLPCVIPPHG